MDSHCSGFGPIAHNDERAKNWRVGREIARTSHASHVGTPANDGIRLDEGGGNKTPGRKKDRLGGTERQW